MIGMSADECEFKEASINRSQDAITAKCQIMRILRYHATFKSIAIVDFLSTVNF